MKGEQRKEQLTDKEHKKLLKMLYWMRSKGLWPIACGLLSIALLSSCCREAVPVNSTTVVHDTTFVESRVIERDTTIIYPGSSTQLIIPVKDILETSDHRPQRALISGPKHLGPPSVVTESKAPWSAVRGQSSLTATIKGTDLRIDCDCDTLAIEAKLYDTYQKEHKQKTTETTITKEVKFIPQWIKVLAWSGGAFYLFMGIGVIRKFKII